MTLLNERFEIVSEIGRGSQAVTHRALDHESGEEVALKELDFRRVEDWKSQELFEREGRTLQSLEHPCIPRYVDAFAVEDSNSIRLFLAQEFVDGPTLAEELKLSRRWTERELVADAMRLLEALDYLHRRMPPVIHRDLKPSNLIRRPDGSIAIVDFGAAQNTLPRTVGGSTVIGTPGYMPMEQLMGRSVPATDLYALGATFVHLLTGVDPSELPVERNRLQFKDKIDCSDALMAVLIRLTEPTVEDRYPSAQAVLDDLRPSFRADTLPTSPRPVGTRDPELAPIPVRTKVAGSEVPHVQWQNRTMGYPGWVNVEPRDGGEFVLTFESMDIRGRELTITIFDEPAGLRLDAWVDPLKQQLAAQRGSEPILLAVVVVMICLFFAPKLFPISIVAAMAILLAKIVADENEDGQHADVEMVIDPQDLRLTRRDEFRVRTTARHARYETANDHDVVLITDREIPLIEFSRHNAYHAAWLMKFLSARTREIAAARDVQLDFGADTAPSIAQDVAVATKEVSK